MTGQARSAKGQLKSELSIPIKIMDDKSTLLEIWAHVSGLVQWTIASAKATGVASTSSDRDARNPINVSDIGLHIIMKTPQVQDVDKHANNTSMIGYDVDWAGTDLIFSGPTTIFIVTVNGVEVTRTTVY